MTRIDDEERRAAAAKLREAASALERDEQLPDGQIVDEVYGACMGGGALGRCTGDLCEVDREFFLRLADLIDRPTCENVHGGREFECSNCGMQWHLLDRADEFEEWAHVRNPRFCPGCGAEVAR